VGKTLDGRVRPFRPHVAIVLAVLGCAALVYWPGLSGPFIFDDFPALVTNQRLHVSALDWGQLWRAATSFDPGGTGRQLAMASFALNHALGGLDPWGWKLGGLLVHLANALLVYLLCLKLLALAGVRQGLQLSAGGLALAWAVHPLQVSTVLYVVQRMETLCLTFTALAPACLPPWAQVAGRGTTGLALVGGLRAPATAGSGREGERTAVAAVYPSARAHLAPL